MNQIQTVNNEIRQFQAEIDSQVATAKKFPRDLELSERNATAMIKNDRKLADSCNYSLTKGGKLITGPSIRLAEIVASTWGNLRCAARINDEDDKWIYVQAFAHDLETNNRFEVEVQRRITKADGKTYGQDMVQTTGQAAISIGFRNALFKVIPYGYVQKLMEIAKTASMGPADKEKEFKDGWLNHFEKMGISRKRLFEKFGAKSQGKMKKSDWAALPGIATAIRDGQTTIENEFPTAAPEPKEEKPLSDEEIRGKIDTAVKDCKSPEAMEEVFVNLEKEPWFNKTADGIFRELFNQMMQIASKSGE